MIKVIIILFFLCLGAVVFYLLHNRNNNDKQLELYKSFLKAIAVNLRRNLEKLEDGDVGWRRLGHGQATIGLKKIAPKKDDVIPVSLTQVRKQYPDIIESVKDIDADIKRLQAAADRVSKALEKPVRARFQADRQNMADSDRKEIRPFRKWLFDREDAWMEILANLINDGCTLTGKSDPGALYWEYAKDSYNRILKKQGGRDLEDLERSKEKIKEKSRTLLTDIESVCEGNE